MNGDMGDVIGVKLASTIAGFAGGVVSLAFVQNLTKWQAVMAVVVGALSAAYLTPWAVEKLGVAPELQNGAAFVIGLCAMSVIPAIKKAVALHAAAQLGEQADPPNRGKGGAT